MKYFDLHIDTVSRSFDEGKSLVRNDCNVDFKRAVEDKYTAFFAIYSNSARFDMNGRYEALVAHLKGSLSDNVGIVTDYDSYRACVDAQKLPIMLSLEGAELLHCDPGRLAEAYYSDGLRLSGICWNNPNLLYDDSGLTAAGKSYLARAASLGIAIDISHANDNTAFDSLASGARIIASHSNARALCPHKRNLSDELIREISRSGGIIGLNFCTAFLSETSPTIASIAEHTAHIAGIGGVGCVALGSDFDGAPLPEGMNGVEDLHKLRRELLIKGFSETEADGILFDNAKNFFLKETAK